MFNEKTPEEIELEELDKLLELEAANLLKLTLRKETLLKSAKIQFFQPSPKQEMFVTSTATRRGVFAGNRFGKSTIGVIEDCSWLLGYRPYYPEGDPRRYAGIPSSGVKGLVIAQDWEKVKEIFTGNEPGSDTKGKFFEWLPEGCVVKTEKNSQGIVNVLHIQSKVHGRMRKSSIYFETVKSFKQDARGAESSDWDFIHVDEPLPQEMWTAVSRGLIDRGGSAWFLLTSLDEAWLFDWISSEAQKNDKFFFLQASMRDNPTLNEGDINDFLSTLTEEERMARELGLPLSSGRLVYHQFNRATHVIEEFPSNWVGSLPPVEYDVVVSIDPHPQTPHAVLFAAIAPTHVIFYSDLFVKTTFTDGKDDDGKILYKGLVSRIKDRIERCRVSYILCDPTAWIKDPETNRCWADVMQEAGLPVQKAPKCKTAGIQQVQSYLSNGRDKKLYFHSSLTQTLWEIGRYHYDRENKPVDKNDHLMECMYRIIAHDDLRYYGPQDEAYPVTRNQNPNNLLAEFTKIK